jgi:hypothetical protein
MSIGNSYPDYHQREKRITKRVIYSLSLLTSKRVEPLLDFSSRSGGRNKNSYSNQGLDAAFSNAKSKQIVELDGAKYKKTFSPNFSNSGKTVTSWDKEWVKQ